MLVILVLASLVPVLQPVDPWSWSEVSKLPPVGPEYFPGVFRGRVTGFVKNGVTIRPEGDVILVHTATLPDNRIKPVAIYRQDNTRPPREFQFAEQLIGGQTHSTHEVADLCIGDLVDIRYARPVAVDLCTQVAILRRPGGKVPPGRDKHLTPESRHHNRCNVQQFVEEKIVPVTIPRLFRSIHP